MELQIDRAAVTVCRELAAAIVAPVEAFIAAHSTVAVERSVLRLLGVDGVGADEVPAPNLIVDALDPAARSAGVALRLREGAGADRSGTGPLWERGWRRAS